MIKKTSMQKSIFKDKQQAPNVIGRFDDFPDHFDFKLLSALALGTKQAVQLLKAFCTEEAS